MSICFSVNTLWCLGKSDLHWSKGKIVLYQAVAVDVYFLGKDNDEGKCYRQTWPENKSLSSGKVPFQSAQGQLLIVASHSYHYNAIHETFCMSLVWQKTTKLSFNPGLLKPIDLILEGWTSRQNENVL